MANSTPPPLGETGAGIRLVDVSLMRLAGPIANFHAFAEYGLPLEQDGVGVARSYIDTNPHANQARDWFLKNPSRRFFVQGVRSDTECRHCAPLVLITSRVIINDVLCGDVCRIFNASSCEYQDSDDGILRLLRNRNVTLTDWEIGR